MIDEPDTPESVKRTDDKSTQVDNSQSNEYPDSIEAVVNAKTPANDETLTNTPEITSANDSAVYANKQKNIRGAGQYQKQEDEKAKELAKKQHELLSLDDYVKKFEDRYLTDKGFRQTVHNHLKITGFQKFKYTLSKILPPLHKKKRKQMILSYATKAYDDAKQVYDLQIQKDIEEMRLAEEEVKRQERELFEKKQLADKIKKDLDNTVSLKSISRKQVETDFYELEKQAKQVAIDEKKRVHLSFDSKKMARQELKRVITSSNMIKKSEDGAVDFNENNIMKKLEDIFLKEIFEDLSKSGDKGFLTKLNKVYQDTTDYLFDYYDQIESMDELRDMDLAASINFSRKMGFNSVVYPYIITGKSLGTVKPVKGQIDTAIAIDSTGSMINNARWDVAKKTGLALEALMRNFNPSNNTYLSHFNYDCWDITASQLFKTIKPQGDTYTDKALYWILRKLEGKIPSIAYLITDGEPTDVDLAVKAAEEFKKHPYIRLRIFYIDPRPDTIKYVEMIGRAAGRETKVISVDSKKLAMGVVKDIASVISGMQSITEYMR